MQMQRLNAGGQLPILLLSFIRMRNMRKRHAVHMIDKNTFSLCAVTAGSGLLHINECSLRFHPGELFFFAPGTKLDTELHSESAQYTLLLFRQMAVCRTKGKWAAAPSEAEASFIPSGKLRDEHSAACMEHVSSLYADSRSSRTQPAALQLQALGLLHALLEAGTNQLDEEEASSGMDESIAYMYKHYDKKLNLETLSAIAGLTPTSYSRSFKRRQGVSPVEFLNQIRIERAKEQLSQPDSTVKNVTALVGFGNEFYFSRLFKRSVGITPTLFIKRKELSVAVVSNYQYHENLYSLGASCVYAMNGFKSELVGRESEARQNFARVEKQAKYVRQRLSGAIGNESVALLRLFKRKVRVQGMVNHPLNELLYSELGLKPGSCVPLNERNHEFTLISLPVIETDHLLIHNHNVMQKEEKLASFEQTNAWKAISAVPHTKTLFIPNWIGMSWAPNGRERIMNELLDWSSSRGILYD
ncbi:AraC family transcriptional regulator [Candidatus Pristimantibacillus sp. PTI5]|uniref:AraC family transcriptional regulator n=1 Tax=Candidatus Pristimantibacillus sp. PTI5 TaxID=3400422 RepID=UPI003B02C7F6